MKYVKHCSKLFHIFLYNEASYDAHFLYTIMSSTDAMFGKVWAISITYVKMPKIEKIAKAIVHVFFKNGQF